MCALIAQHGNVLATLVALWQQPKAQQNDEQTNSLKNHVPHINVLAEFACALSTRFKLVFIRGGFPLPNCICTCITYLRFKEHRHVFFSLLGFKISNFYVLCISFTSNIKMA